MYHFRVVFVPTLHNANTMSQNPCYKSAKDCGTGLQKSPWQIGYTTTEGSDRHTDTQTMKVLGEPAECTGGVNNMGC